MDRVTWQREGRAEKSRNLCYENMYCMCNIAIFILNWVAVCIPDQESGSYASLGLVRQLSNTKYQHLQAMNRDFIPEDRRIPSITID